MEDQAGGGDLDVLAGGGRGEDTGGDTVRDAVLVHLLRQTLDFVHVGGGGAVAADGVAVGIELGLAAGRAGAGLVLELAVGGLFRESLLLGGGRRHFDGVCVGIWRGFFWRGGFAGKVDFFHNSATRTRGIMKYSSLCDTVTPDGK